MTQSDSQANVASDTESTETVTVPVSAQLVRQLDDEQLMRIVANASERNALAEECERLRDAVRRVQADFENAHKRMERQKNDAVRYALQPFATEMLPVLDNLDRALAASGASKDFDGLSKGVAMTFAMLRNTLASFGISELNPVGEPFDPEVHEAVSMGSDATKDDNVVLAVFEKGFKLHERVVRHAKVQVNRKPS